jgi:hypothetical protein
MYLSFLAIRQVLFLLISWFENNYKVKFSKFDCVVHDQQSMKMIVMGFKVGRFFLFIYLSPRFSLFSITCNLVHIDC